MGRLLKISDRRINQKFVIDLEGEITLVDARELRSRITSCSEEDSCDYIVINLANVPYVDSIGLGILLEMNKTFPAEGIKFALMNLTANVDELLEVSQGKSFFTILNESDL